MISRTRRLRAEEVREVLTQGSRSRAGALSLRYLPTGEPLRAAVVAPKARYKTAVERNRLRRAVYRALRGAQAARGRAVFFIDAVPSAALAPAYYQDIKALLKL